MKNQKGEIIEYFWELEYPFFLLLKKIFQEKCKRKYSLNGNGIFNLIYLDGKCYEVKFSQAKKMLENDNRTYSDKNKELIIKSIIENFKNIKEYSINSGKYITFTIGDWIGKIEVIKKIKEPI